jgi:hypothetical protein
MTFLDGLVVSCIICGTLGLLVAAWNGDIWFIGVAIVFLLCSFVLWQAAR